MKNAIENGITIPIGGILISANLTIPQNAKGIVVFSHGSGSSRLSPRNKFVAGELNKKQIATLLVDLLTPKEDENYETRFDIELLTERLVGVTKWILHHPDLKHYSIGYFGASTGAASALNAAGQFGDKIHAVVSRGGRTDLAGGIVHEIKAPTLFIVGSLDTPVIELNKKTFKGLTCDKELIIVKWASHLFEEEGKLAEMAKYATTWFQEHLNKEVYA